MTSEKRRIFLVLNPVSGVHSPDMVWRRFKQRCEEAGHEVNVYRTTGDENLKSIVQSAAAQGYDLFVAAGGDGTVSAVADGLYGTRIPLAILPVGTWNALARNLEIPLLIDPAIRLITGEHRELEIDGMLINGRLYLLNAGAGLSAETMEKTERRQKRMFGWLAYIWNIVLQFFGLQLHSFSINVDGTPLRVRASEVMIMNSNLTAIKEISNRLELRPDDGKLELCVVRARSLPGFLLMVWNILVRKPYRNPRFEVYAVTRSAVVRTRRPVRTQADGDILGYTPLEVQVVPKAARLIVPLEGQFGLLPALEKISSRVLETILHVVETPRDLVDQFGKIIHPKKGRHD